MTTRPYLSSLRGKITNRILLFGVLPLMLLGGIGYYGLTDLLGKTQMRQHSDRDNLEKAVGINLVSSAAAVAHRLDGFMLERISDVLTWASALVIADASKNATSEFAKRGLVGQNIEVVEAIFEDQKSLGIYDQAEYYLQTQVQNSPHFGEIFTTDINGYNVALTNPTSDFVQSDEAWWVEAFEKGIFVGQAEFDKSAEIWSVDVAVRIADPASGQPLGVRKAVLGVSFIQQVADESIRNIAGNQITVLNNNGLFLAETRSDHARNRIMIDSINLDSALSDVATQIAADGNGYVSLTDSVVGFAASAPGDFYDSVIANFPGFGWEVVIEQPAEIAFSPLKGLAGLQQSLENFRQIWLYILAAAAVFVIALAIMIAAGLSKRMINPIVQLQALADRVSIGDTSKPIRVDTDDEIEDLAQNFDHMRASLKTVLKHYRQMREKEG